MSIVWSVKCWVWNIEKSLVFRVWNKDYELFSLEFGVQKVFGVWNVKYRKWNRISNIKDRVDWVWSYDYVEDIMEYGIKSI